LAAKGWNKTLAVATESSAILKMSVVLSPTGGASNGVNLARKRWLSEAEASRRSLRLRSLRPFGQAQDTAPLRERLKQPVNVFLITHVSQPSSGVGLTRGIGRASPAAKPLAMGFASCEGAAATGRPMCCQVQVKVNLSDRLRFVGNQECLKLTPLAEHLLVHTQTLIKHPNGQAPRRFKWI
jgi:hypothetical protein